MPSKEMRPVFATTVIKPHPEDYMLVSIPREQENNARQTLRDLKPFSSITYDHEEVSVVLKVTDWNELRDQFNGCEEEGPYSLITFDIVLDLNLVGFLSVVSALLAENGISIYALSTYLRDHILVKKEDSDRTVLLLRELVDRCKTTI
ncbi:MAG: ACT domain-containing protein [Candidatus Bathyarchaeota archaeon]|nr:ACT domain-containing protein [Candidatus Bathyarchaeota archaeon]